jgi:hypothetical protein
MHAVSLKFWFLCYIVRCGFREEHSVGVALRIEFDILKLILLVSLDHAFNR